MMIPPLDPAFRDFARDMGDEERRRRDQIDQARTLRIERHLWRKPKTEPRPNYADTL